MLSEFMCNSSIEAPEPVWELRARSYRVITNTEVVRSRHAELVGIAEGISALGFPLSCCCPRRLGLT
jgi:hypothetical protein